MSGIVIIGGGLTGGTAARMLRTEGYGGDITIVAGEDHYPYQRPPLSKEYLLGKAGLDQVYLKPAQWYADQKITVFTGNPAVSLDPAAHTLTLADGTQLDYDRALIATGSRARHLPIEGADLSGVYQLRTLDDSQALSERLHSGKQRVVFIGSGWIGLEVAAAARTLGNEATVIDTAAVPLARALGPTLGEEFEKLHLEHGVKFVLNAHVEAIEGANGHVTGVRADGVTYPADMVVVGVGAVPNTELAEAAGIEVGGGIVTDAGLRTSAADVFAAGDVANTWNETLGERLRSEHWMNALAGGKAAAKALAGEDVVYDPIPYFYSDQYDMGMELSGYPPLMTDARVVIRGDLEGRKYIAFWLDDENRVVAGMNVNIWDMNKSVQELIRSGRPVRPEQLEDPKVPLDQSDLLWA